MTDDIYVPQELKKLVIINYIKGNFTNDYFKARNNIEYVTKVFEVFGAVLSPEKYEQAIIGLLLYKHFCESQETVLSYIKENTVFDKAYEYVINTNKSTGVVSESNTIH